ncbi:MAG TPA: hypothetical protein VGC45_06535 [Gryllotalpicola sp.]
MTLPARIRLTLAGLALAAGGLSGIAAASPTATPTPPPPGLSIAIDNGAKSTAPDSDVKYTVTFTNAGTDPVTASIVASIPAYGKITDAGGGQVKAQDDTWKVTVAAGKKQSETVTAHIGAIPKGSYRVTALASVYLGEDTSGAPLIRSADSDAIPGVKEPTAPAPTSTATATATASSGAAIPPIAIGIGGGILVVIAALVVAIVLIRRGRARKPRRRAV